MKITKAQLKQIIKEELEKVLHEENPTSPEGWLLTQPEKTPVLPPDIGHAYYFNTEDIAWAVEDGTDGRVWRYNRGEDYRSIDRGLGPRVWDQIYPSDNEEVRYRELEEKQGLNMKEKLHVWKTEQGL